MIRTVCFLLVGSFLISCSTSLTQFDRSLNRAAIAASRQIEKEFDYVSFSGMGGSQKDGIIQYETLMFHVNQPISREEGTQILDAIVNAYLSKIYSEKHLESYLKEYPFNYCDLEVMLFVYSEEGDEVLHPDIGIFSLQQGVITYETMVRSEKYYFETVSKSEEPYEDAAKRLALSSTTSLP